MAYTLQVFVGSRHGTWAVSPQRFDEPAGAEAAIATLKAAEKKACATALQRRIVRV
jgi:hypothetical protein